MSFSYIERRIFSKLLDSRGDRVRDRSAFGGPCNARPQGSSAYWWQWTSLHAHSWTNHAPITWWSIFCPSIVACSWLEAISRQGVYAAAKSGQAPGQQGHWVRRCIPDKWQFNIQLTFCTLFGPWILSYFILLFMFCSVLVCSSCFWNLYIVQSVCKLTGLLLLLLKFVQSCHLSQFNVKLLDCSFWWFVLTSGLFWYCKQCGLLIFISFIYISHEQIGICQFSCQKTFGSLTVLSNICAFSIYLLAEYALYPMNRGYRSSSIYYTPISQTSPYKHKHADQL